MTILDLFGKGEIDAAFELLDNEYQANPKQWEDALILLSRYRRLGNDSVKGLLSYENQNIAENNLINDTIGYLRMVEKGGEATPEPSLPVLNELINDDSLAQASEDLKLLKGEFPGSKLLVLAGANLDLRRGLNTVSRDTVDDGFTRLYELLCTNDTEVYKTTFCLMLAYRIEFYEAWSLPLPVYFDFTYNTYIGASPLQRDFLVKLKLSSKAKREIRNVYKNL